MIAFYNKWVPLRPCCDRARSNDSPGTPHPSLSSPATCRAEVVPEKSYCKSCIGWILNPDHDPGADEEFLRKRLLGNEELIAFARSLLQGVLRNREELDQALAACAENWSLDRMAVTDRNVLRLGAYEILYTDVPRPAAINEAVELARRFGSRHSSQFVNGILDRFMKGGSPS